MYAFISPSSLNPFTIFNGLLHAVELHGCPAVVVLFYTSGSRTVVEGVRMALGRICPESRIDARRVYGSFRRDYGLYRAAVEELRRSGLRVVVNITPGTKLMSLAAYMGAVEGGADEVFYLSVRDSSYSRELLPFIPKHALERAVLVGADGEG